MRNMSFYHTTEQFKNRTKTITRRLGWQFLKPGDIVMGCVKCRGLKRGEKIEYLGPIRIVSGRRERLNQITDEDVIKEGFPDITRMEFVEFFIKKMRPVGGVVAPVTRIEFEYM